VRPGLKFTLLTSTVGEIVTSVTFDVPKLAMSDGPFGTVLGTQLAAVFQSPVEGFVLHVALPARDCRCAARDSGAAATATRSLCL
jgi:hypothetical protein